MDHRTEQHDAAWDGKSVTFLAALEYGSVLSGRTGRLAESLARRGVETTFVELLGTRASIFRSLGMRRRAVPNGPIHVCSAPPAPFFRSWATTPCGRAWARWAARRLANSLPGLKTSAVIVSNPIWAMVLEHLQVGLLCYDWIDHVKVHSGAAALELFARWEQRLLAQARAVAIIRPEMAREMPAESRAIVRLIPNAVAEEWLSPVSPARAPFERRDGRRVVGFLGAMYEWVDLACVARAARELPDWDFVLAGPVRNRRDLDVFAGLANVRVFPAQPFNTVRHWIAAFDVALIPFLQNEITSLADPIKLYEYYALGVPVVSTVAWPLPQDAPPLEPAGSDMSLAIVKAYNENSIARQQARIAFARANTWLARTDDLLAMLNQAKV